MASRQLLKDVVDQDECVRTDLAWMIKWVRREAVSKVDIPHHRYLLSLRESAGKTKVVWIDGL